MEVTQFIELLESDLGIDAYYGVPDSLLRALGDELYARHGLCEKHLIAADEGGAVALAAGHFLATGKPAVVYLQNSGIGNAVNPICSLLNEKVYAIPALFVVGWRGEPGVHDEPQHVFQGECSESLLQTIGLSVFVLDASTSAQDLIEAMKEMADRFGQGKSCAILVRKGALSRAEKPTYENNNTLTRERAVQLIIDSLPADAAVVSTTGKLSRELFELREAAGAGHARDFLTVGSMGHSCMIGLGVAQAQPNRRVIVLDGDGACLMHTGALAVLASQHPSNLLHVLINNEAHESVGGLPTVSSSVDWSTLALAAGYVRAYHADDEQELREALAHIEEEGDMGGALFLEVVVSLQSRADLGRPTTTAYDNGRNFQAFLLNG